MQGHAIVTVRAQRSRGGTAGGYTVTRRSTSRGVTVRACTRGGEVATADS